MRAEFEMGGYRMTREEAAKRIEYLKFKAEVVLANSNTESVRLKAGVEATITALTTAIKELKRQQTTRYEHIYTRVTYWGKHKHGFKCETCGLTKEFTDNHTAQYKYCPSCGRKINWSKPKGDSYDFAIIGEAAVQKGNKDD